MELISTPIEGLVVLQPRVFSDDRGYFFESYNRQAFEKLGLNYDFVQDNQSFSRKNVLRGLHFQYRPFAQAKLVRVITGAVLDVAVDLRRDSPTFGQHYAVKLTGENKTMLLIPDGFAHGFATLEDNTVFSYKCSNYYDKASEDCILWNDPDLGIDWGVSTPVISEKDSQGKPFKAITNLF